MKIIDLLRNIFGRKLALKEPNQQNITTKGNDPWRRSFFYKVPGIRDTRFAKKNIISRYVTKYRSLYNDRDALIREMYDLENSLKLSATTTRNADDLAEISDTLTERKRSLEDLKTLGKKDPNQLTPEELNLLQTYLKYQNLPEQIDKRSVQILAVRQGLLNRADPEHSQLSEALLQQHSNAQTFIDNLTEQASQEFIRATNLIIEREDLQAVAKLTTLPIDNDRIKTAYDNSPFFKQYCDILFAMNKNGQYKFPLKFDEDKDREGGILINLAGRQNDLTPTL